MPVITPPFDKKHATLTDVSTPHVPADINQTVAYNLTNASSTFAGKDVAGHVDATAGMHGWPLGYTTLASHAHVGINDAPNIAQESVAGLSGSLAAKASIAGGTIAGGTVNAAYAFNLSSTSGTFAGVITSTKIGVAASTLYGDGSQMTGVSAAYRRFATKVVAASNSKDTTNADYVCDGAADEVQINAALNASSAAPGGCVLLMDGTYDIDASITIPADNMSLVGMGKCTQLTSTYNGNLILIKDRNGILIQSLYISGSAGLNAQNGIYDNAAAVRADSGIMIINNWIENCGSYGMYLGYDTDPSAGAQDVLIDGNWIKGCGGRAITPGGGASNWIISNNRIENCGTAIWISNANCNNIFVHGNLIIGNTAGIVDVGTNTAITDNTHTTTQAYHFPGGDGGTVVV